MKHCLMAMLFLLSVNILVRAQDLLNVDASNAITDCDKFLSSEAPEYERLMLLAHTNIKRVVENDLPAFVATFQSVFGNTFKSKLAYIHAELTGIDRCWIPYMSGYFFAQNDPDIIKQLKLFGAAFKGLGKLFKKFTVDSDFSENKYLDFLTDIASDLHDMHYILGHRIFAGALILILGDLQGLIDTMCEIA
ncbi:MAG: hypothetical protein NTX86_02620 [Candidatus Dependentiae bacterium]|nr:hypothetical protein [Candidatus Dependentiae bacterium]